MPWPLCMRVINVMTPSCSSQVPEVVAAQGESPDALQGAALKSVWKHWFSTKERLQTTQVEYYKVASNEKKRDAMPDLDKMLKKLGLSSYAEFKTRYINLFRAQIKIIDDFSKIAYLEKNGKILKITINSIHNIDQDPLYSHIFKKMPDMIFTNDSHYFDSGSHNNIIDNLKSALGYEDMLRQYDLREIILNYPDSCRSFSYSSQRAYSIM